MITAISEQPGIAGVRVIPPGPRSQNAARRQRRSEWSDREIIKACLAGDELAWNEIVDRYTRLVYSVPIRLGLCEADAEEVHQATFLSLFKHLSSIRDRTRLGAWLTTTARRHSYRVARRSQRVNSSAPDAIDQECEPDDDASGRSERQHLVRQALDRLAERDRALMEALFQESGQPNYQAIAVRLDIPIGSIGPTRARCFRKLERILDELGYQPQAD